MHFSFFLKNFQNDENKKILQEIYDFNFRQLELSIREIGYGDVSVNKKMKDYVNLFYLILEKIEAWDNMDKSSKMSLFGEFINIKDNSDFFINYFDKYRDFLLNNPLKIFTKDILELKF